MAPTSRTTPSGRAGAARGRGPGRPPAGGEDKRERILVEALGLFALHGYAGTSLADVAQAAEISKPGLLHHFPSKTEIFLTLLKSTVEPSMVLAGDLANLEASPELRLWALVAAEVRLLLSTKWNVGRLYQLPIVASEEFDEYHKQRATLTDTFRSLATEIVGENDPRAELPFHITMSAIEMRRNDGKVPSPLTGDSLPDTAVMLADAALAVLGADLPGDRVERTLELLRQADGK